MMSQRSSSLFPLLAMLAVVGAASSRHITLDWDDPNEVDEEDLFVTSELGDEDEDDEEEDLDDEEDDVDEDSDVSDEEDFLDEDDDDDLDDDDED